MFAVRFWTAHGKGNGFDVRLTLTHGKGDEQPNGVNVPLGKNVCRAPQWFAVRQHKNARQTIFLPGVFITVRRGKCARQSSSLSCARKYAHNKD
jgi:hypothetical protein